MSNDYIVGQYNLYTIKIVPIKRNYQPLIANSQLITLNSPPMRIPFGPEKYGFMDVINLQFTNKDRNNIMYNFYSQIISIDRFFEKIGYDKKFQDKLNLSSDFKNFIANKDYQSAIKMNLKFDPLLRCQLKKKGTMLETIVEKDGIQFPIFNTKGEMVTIKIFVNNIWANQNNFGLTWVVEYMKLV